MVLSGLLHNRVLIAALIAWGTAQIIKVPVDYFRTRQWHWSLLLTVGGMPSSHSALIVGATNAIGLFYGYANPMFALGVGHCHDRYVRRGRCAPAGRHACRADQYSFRRAAEGAYVG